MPNEHFYCDGVYFLILQPQEISIQRASHALPALGPKYIHGHIYEKSSNMGMQVFLQCIDLNTCIWYTWAFQTFHGN